MLLVSSTKYGSLRSYVHEYAHEVGVHASRLDGTLVAKFASLEVWIEKMSLNSFVFLLCECFSSPRFSVPRCWRLGTDCRRFDLPKVRP
jgi:hypothetical protein